jgi:hypothetical protein
MTLEYFSHGELHAPYFIFVGCAGEYPDADLLRHFGLSYQPAASTERRDRYAILADDGLWTLLADDLYHTLWHMASTRPAIAALSKRFDIFACSVGDCDRSFDFVYYQGGRLVREYVVRDPDFRGGVVVVNRGEPLLGEAAAFEETDEMRIVLRIADSLGIRTDYAENELRVYSPVGA